MTDDQIKQHIFNELSEQSKFMPDSYRSGFGFATDIIRKMTFGGESGWISVDERLPEYGQHVLVISNNCNHVDVRKFTSDKDLPWSEIWRERSGGVIVSALEVYPYWQPLPAPPQAEKGGRDGDD